MDSVEALPFHWDPPEVKGVALTSSRIEGVIDEILDEFSDNGFLAASVWVAEFVRTDEGYDVRLEASPGPRATIQSIRLQGDDRTNPGFVSRFLRLNPPQAAAGFDLEKASSSLRSAGFHRQVGAARYELINDSTAVLVIPADPFAAGSFDIIAGFLPANGNQAAQFVGSGHLQLKNAFGRGRSFSMAVDRLPAQSSGVQLGYRDPLFRGWPISVMTEFEGYQQDSTYSTTRLSGGLGMLLADGVEIIVRFNRESTRPGGAGSLIVDGLQRIARSNGTYWGVETSISRLDNPGAPRSGVYLKAMLETGERTRNRARIQGADTVRVSTRDQQERLQIEARGYFSFARKWTLVTALEGRFTFSDQLDESELYRIGGAKSLRGYDENRFTGKSVARAVLEMRVHTDEFAFGYAFFDLGYVEARQRRASSLYPGFGVGLSFETAIGPLNVSYAMNTEEPLSNGRIHIALSFGL